MTDYRTNGYAQEKRLLKAAYIVDGLRATGITADECRTFTPEQRRQAEQIARTRPASDLTWQVVQDLMDRGEGLHTVAQRTVACPSCGWPLHGGQDCAQAALDRDLLVSA